MHHLLSTAAFTVAPCWVTTTYRGGYGPISRPCAGRSVSEHKEGRAFDWMNDATKATDRARTSCHVVQERRS